MWPARFWAKPLMSRYLLFAMSESISDALNQLTPRERTVFELKHYQGLKLRTIGEMLNTTEETAKNTLFRATRKLRANLAELRA